MKTIEQLDHGVSVKADTSRNPVTVAVYDGDERISQPVAALQKESVIWMAQGYVKAKEKYE